MTITEAEYFAIRTELLRNEGAGIVALERKYMEFLRDVIVDAAPDMYRDFCQAIELKSFWVNYPPIQRGRAPRRGSCIEL
jgi:Restriction endonuclease BglI